MPKSARGVAEAATNIHSRMKAIAEPVGALLVDAFHYLALFAIGATTVWSASTAFFGMVGKGRAELSDLLLLSSISKSARWSASILKRRSSRFAI